MAASYSLEIHAPDEVLTHTTPGTAPCTFALARVEAQAQGVPIPPATDARSVERAAARVPGDEPVSIPIDLVFERLYLGFLPATALRMLVVMVLVVVPTVSLVLRPMQRVCGGEPRP